MLYNKISALGACAIFASLFIACSESKFEGSPTDALNDLSLLGSCNASNINEVRSFDNENFYRCDGKNWVEISTSSNSSDSNSDYDKKVVESESDLPACTAINEGSISLVSDMIIPYICHEGKWHVYDASFSEKNPSSSSNSSSSLFDGKLVDSRDGKVYRTVQIGSQVWMAENLNYELPDGSDGLCYDGIEANCEKYGRLYTWKTSQNICPSGWHLPSDEEWNELLAAVGGISTAGQMLKSESTWTGSYTGKDAYGFGVLATGWYTSSGTYSGEGTYGGLWSTATQYRWGFFNSHNTVERGTNGSTLKNGVRCLLGESIIGISSSSVKSSSSIKSSSSVKSSSSSVVVIEPNPEITYGKLIDSRDGKSYRTVEIGTQIWMAENLNYELTGTTTDGLCYDNDESNCEQYGRLYTWTTAQTVCPSGWHLPSDSEWSLLATAIGGTSSAGSLLKSKTSWSSASYNGTDTYGFGVLAAGYYYTSGGFLGKGTYGGFWSTVSQQRWAFFGNQERVESGTNSASYQNSVRCLKGEPVVVFSSSSVRSSSSSVVVVEPNPEITYGELVDSRDDKSYRTVEIGTQVWMAENLNYELPGTTTDGICFDNMEEKCDVYGRYYTWTTAQTVCPAGWHLPSDSEWELLFTSVGGTSTAGSLLKAKTSWSSSGNGSDIYGFGVLAVGWDDGAGSFRGEGTYGGFWSTATQYRWGFFSSSKDVQRGTNGAGLKNAVRCLKDDPSTEVDL